jgi:hypothetical protein
MQSKTVALVKSYKASAPKEIARGVTLPFLVVDGIVPNPRGKFPAGPKAVILPRGINSNNKHQ